MPFTKEQLKVYWQTNKEILNQKRRQKRRLARLAILGKVSHCEVSQIKQKQVSPKSTEVSQKQKKIIRQLKTANPKIANETEVSPHQVSHQKEMANLKADNYLAQLIKEWQTQTNYSCASTCTHSYCNNCWYFSANELVDYKVSGLSIRP